MGLSKKEIRIGLLGGTFNPIHIGHLRAAEEIREKFQLDKVIFVPSKIPPHKISPEVISPLHRISMVKRAIKANPFFSVSDIELRRKGTSYSIQTIRYFRRRYGQDVQLFFILGEDAFREITIWKDYKKIFTLCDWIVMKRPGYPLKTIKEIIPVELKQFFCYQFSGNILIHRSNHRLYFTEITLLDISSSLIRERIKGGKSIRYLLPNGVEEYIEKNRLYHAKGQADALPRLRKENAQ
jgi:nicotinate-nucleotide adenylyltransferase